MNGSYLRLFYFILIRAINTGNIVDAIIIAIWNYALNAIPSICWAIHNASRYLRRRALLSRARKDVLWPGYKGLFCLVLHRKKEQEVFFDKQSNVSVKRKYKKLRFKWARRK